MSNIEHIRTLSSAISAVLEGVRNAELTVHVRSADAFVSALHAGRAAMIEHSNWLLGDRSDARLEPAADGGRDKLTRGLNEAIEYAKGNTEGSRTTTYSVPLGGQNAPAPTTPPPWEPSEPRTWMLDILRREGLTDWTLELSSAGAYTWHHTKTIQLPDYNSPALFLQDAVSKL